VLEEREVVTVASLSSLLFFGLSVVMSIFAVIGCLQLYLTQKSRFVPLRNIYLYVCVSTSSAPVI